LIHKKDNNIGIQLKIYMENLDYKGKVLLRLHHYNIISSIIDLLYWFKRYSIFSFYVILSYNYQLFLNCINITFFFIVSYAFAFIIAKNITKHFISNKWIIIRDRNDQHSHYDLYYTLHNSMGCNPNVLSKY
jgi:hypothetical protein